MASVRLRLLKLEDRTVLSPPGTGWQQLFADEFNGTSLDTTAWAPASGARRDAVNTSAAVSVGGGYLTITTYTSGGTHYTGFIGTSSAFRATYGYWEARISYNDSPGMWSAFWLQSPTMGNPIGDPATAGTEIDISEHRAVDSGGADIRNKSVSNLHWDGYGASHQSVGSGLVSGPTTPSLQGNFHNYGLEWDPTGYKFYIDEVVVWSTSQAVSKRSEFIYLTSEVQNASWAGSIPSGGYGSLSTSTTKMNVDWVRVWQKPVSNISDIQLPEDTPAGPISFQSAQRDNYTTTITGSSSNANLIPVSGVVIAGSGANRTVTVTPASNQTGNATVTINSAVGPINGSDSFNIQVNAGSFVNGTFEDTSSGGGWSGYSGAAIQTTNVRSGSRSIKLPGSSGSEQVVTGLSPNTTYVLGGWGKVTAAGTPALLGVKNYGGSQVSSTVSSTTYTKVTRTFTTGATSTSATVFVYKPTTSDDGYFDDVFLFRAPTIAAIGGQSTAQNTSSLPIPVTLDFVSSAANSYSLTATSSNLSLVPNANLLWGGSLNSRTLTATPVNGQYGTTNITVTVVDTEGGSASRTFALNVVAAPANIVAVNAGNANNTTQRSMVDRVTVQFDRLVTFASSAVAAFRVERLVNGVPSGSPLSISAATATVNNATVVTITFTNAVDREGSSLRDGRYRVTVLASQVLVGGTAMVSDTLRGFHRYFGDVDGNGAVDGDDLAIFVGSLFNPSGFNLAFDSDGNGAVDGDDLARFVSRLFVPLS